jgi:hypothetical protein
MDQNLVSCPYTLQHWQQKGVAALSCFPEILFRPPLLLLGQLLLQLLQLH